MFSSVGRATALQAVGRRFDPCNTHQLAALTKPKCDVSSNHGAVVQLVRIPACHAGGRGFKSRPLRHFAHGLPQGKHAQPAGTCFSKYREAPSMYSLPGFTVPKTIPNYFSLNEKIKGIDQCQSTICEVLGIPCRKASMMFVGDRGNLGIERADGYSSGTPRRANDAISLCGGAVKWQDSCREHKRQKFGKLSLHALKVCLCCCPLCSQNCLRQRSPGPGRSRCWCH